jgi:hypothetical protein
VVLNEQSQGGWESSSGSFDLDLVLDPLSYCWVVLCSRVQVKSAAARGPPPFVMENTH